MPNIIQLIVTEEGLHLPRHLFSRTGAVDVLTKT